MGIRKTECKTDAKNARMWWSVDHWFFAGERMPRVHMPNGEWSAESKDWMSQIYNLSKCKMHGRGETNKWISTMQAETEKSSCGGKQE